MRALAIASLVILGALPSASSEPTTATFPFDFVFEADTLSTEPTRTRETFVAYSEHEWIRADLEDFELIAARYSVHVLMKPPGCTSAAHWGEHTFVIPDHANVLAPLEWHTSCDPFGVWTIEITAEASPLAIGGLRVHVSDI